MHITIQVFHRGKNIHPVEACCGQKKPPQTNKILKKNVTWVHTTHMVSSKCPENTEVHVVSKQRC